MAGTLLSRLPPSRTTDAMFELLVDSLRNLSDEARRQLAGEPLCVVTPAAVDPAARDRYGQALMKALPGLRAPDFTVDATLIAGFELRGGHLQVRNSWRADLDRMLARLREGHHDEPGR
jgi:F-type H+-transporting ATPase subunit b